MNDVILRKQPSLSAEEKKLLDNIHSRNIMEPNYTGKVLLHFQAGVLKQIDETRISRL